MSEQTREVTLLMLKMRAEYSAGNRIIEKLGELPQDLQAYFITKRVDNMEHCQQELIALVGQEQASQILAEVGL